MRERALNTVSDPDGGSQNGSGRRGGVLPSRRNRLRRENPPPTRRAPPPAAARPSPAPGPNRRNHAFSAAAGSEWSRGRSWRNACCAVDQGAAGGRLDFKVLIIHPAGEYSGYSPAGLRPGCSAEKVLGRRSPCPLIFTVIFHDGLAD